MRWRKKDKVPADASAPARPPRRIPTALRGVWHPIRERLFIFFRAKCAQWFQLYTSGPTAPPEWQRPVWPGNKFLLMPRGKVKALFPNEAIYDPLIREASSTFGIPVALIKAVIAKESSFRPNVTKEEPHVKAPQYGIDGDRSYGLMQILVSTARDRGFQGAPEGLFDERTNIMVGTKHLKWLQERYGDTTRVIAAYNAGSPRMSKTRPGEFENQEYVSKVLGWLRKFRESEGAGTVLASVAFPLILLLVFLYLRR